MFFDPKMLFRMTLKPLVAAAILIGILLLALCCCPSGVPDPGEDEAICLRSMRDIVGRGQDSDNMELHHLAVAVYEKCMDSRREQQRYKTDSLEAEYLEKLQTCNERTQEAYDSWMACAYPNLVELEEQAHTYNDQRGETDAGDMREVRGVGEEGRGR
jgi:hypothetical protein